MRINQLRILELRIEELGNSGIEDWGLRDCEFWNSGIANERPAGVAPSTGSGLPAPVKLRRDKERGKRGWKAI